MKLPRLYAITDVALTQMSHAEQVKSLCKGGATLIQLREKEMSSSEFFEQANEAVKVGRAAGATVIINDRVDIALSLNAGGVHLGQNDLDPTEARLMLGADFIIGFSTHTPDQVKRALSLPIDYLAFGPIFPTSTKSNPDAVVGLDGLRLARQLAPSLPLVAIGGINGSNALSVFGAGADSVAVIGALLSDPSAISAKTHDFLQITRRLA